MEMEIKGMAKGDGEEEDRGSLTMLRVTYSHNSLGRGCLCKEINLRSPPWLEDEEDAWGGLLLQPRQG
jgi:hypothetical protein